MIRLAIILLALSIPGISKAQFSENNQIFFSYDFSIGSHLGVSPNVNYVYKKKISFQAGYSEFQRAAI